MPLTLRLPTVIPSQAGTHFDLCDRAVTKTGRLKSQWFPACAGMTVRTSLKLVTLTRGGDLLHFISTCNKR